MADGMNFAPFTLSPSNNTVTQGGNLAFTGANTHAGTETFNGSTVLNGPVTYGVTAETYAAAMVSDFAGAEMRTLALGGPVTSWTTANRAAGRRLRILIKSLTDAVFARAGVATDPYTGVQVSNDVPKWTEPNQSELAYPEDFLPWTYAGAYPVPAAFVQQLGPFDMSMTLIAADTTNAAHAASYISTLIPGSAVYSCYIRAAGSTFARMNLGTVGNAWFDLSAGAVGTQDAGITGGIKVIAPGLYRCWVVGSPAGNHATCTIAPASADATTTYTGDGVSGIYVWGANAINESHPAGYIGPSLPGRGVGMANAATNLLTANCASVETDLTGFTATGTTPATLTRDTTQAWTGAASIQAVCNGSATNQGFNVQFTVGSAGDHSFGVYLWGSGTVILNMVGGTSGLASTSSGPIVLDSVKRCYHFNVGSSVNTGTVICSVYTNSAQAVTFNADGLMAARISNWFDWAPGGTTRVVDKLSVPSSVPPFDSTNPFTIIGGIFFDGALPGSTTSGSSTTILNSKDSVSLSGISIAKANGGTTFTGSFNDGTLTAVTPTISGATIPRGYNVTGMTVTPALVSFWINNATTSVAGTGSMCSVQHSVTVGYRPADLASTMNSQIRFLACLSRALSAAEMSSYTNMHDPSVMARLAALIADTGGYFIDFGAVSAANGGNLAPSRPLTLGTGWKVAGTVPVSLYSGKQALLELSCYGTNETDVFASYRVVS